MISTLIRIGRLISVSDGTHITHKFCPDLILNSH